MSLHEPLDLLLRLCQLPPSCGLLQMREGVRSDGLVVWVSEGGTVLILERQRLFVFEAEEAGWVAPTPSCEGMQQRQRIY